MWLGLPGRAGSAACPLGECTYVWPPRSLRKLGSQPLRAAAEMGAAGVAVAVGCWRRKLGWFEHYRRNGSELHNRRN